MSEELIRTAIRVLACLALDRQHPDADDVARLRAAVTEPRFYKLVRTLESYKKILDDKTTAVLSSDSELLKIMMQGEAGSK
jgi:hypothetical protein